MGRAEAAFRAEPDRAGIDTEWRVIDGAGAAHLACHGITATATAAIAKDADVGDVLLSRAADHGADLIVMGAYGHSRTHE
jgi:nucleotide-binding universal stress UspA family protein